MKKFILTSFIFFALVSCHNYVREQEDNQAKLSADSARTADSINKANNDNSEKVSFQKEVEHQIDSMESRLAYLDSAYANDKKTEKSKWVSNRKNISIRIERLKVREKEAGKIAKEQWTAFKQEIDTAIQNIKYEWKNGE